MTRQEYLKKLSLSYQIVGTISSKEDYAIYRFRNKKLNKDIIVRSYAQQVKAYDELLNIRCENLPEIYDVIKLEDGSIILEEFIDGMTVAQVIEGQYFIYQGAKKIVKSVCAALSVLHEQSLVHRDVKPENIMIDQNGRVVLIDFNAARKVTTTDKDTVVMGTIGYASPEQLGISQSDTRTDIYAVGILLNVMLTGTHPSHKMASGKAASIIRKCTQIDPDDRYQNVNKLSDAL